MDVQIMTGDEPFSYYAVQQDYSVKDFWAWNSSNLLSNTLRGALAEFIVAKALLLPLVNARNDWTDYDLLYGDCKIEVKSAAYLQAWEQHKFSDIRFSIAPSRSWTSSQCYDIIQIRHSNIYVFCLYNCKDRQIANPLCLDQWVFYVLDTDTINLHLNQQKTISLQRLLEFYPITANYKNLKRSIDEVWSSIK